MDRAQLCGTARPAFRGGPTADPWTFPQIGLSDLAKSVPLWFWLAADVFMVASVI
ncbi:unnamed protein product, partial [Chrysoparadoxa australica]